MDPIRAMRRSHPLARPERRARDRPSLRTENARFVDSVRTPLYKSLSLCRGKDGGLTPDIALHWSTLKSDFGPAASLLLAFAQLAQYAQRFDAFSTEKTAFYDLALRKLKMRAHGEGAIGGARLIATHRAPRFKVDIMQWSWGPMRDSSVDALVAVLTSATLTQEMKQLVHTFLRDSVRLRVKQSEFTTGCLLRIECVLDRIAAQPASEQLHVRILSLKNHRMTHEQFAVLTGIVKKNPDVYRIRELELDNTLTGSASVEDAAAFEALLAALFQPRPLVEGAVSGSPRALCRVSLGRNALRSRHYAVICSALRYGGGAIEELSLAGTMDGMDVGERQVCWRWLAFGVFYPRSRVRNMKTQGTAAAAADFKLCRINLSGLLQYQTDADAFVTKMLRNPMKAERGLTYSCLRTCTLALGSEIRETVDDSSPVIWTVDGGERHDFEVIREICGWTCVVVPASGLGWVATSQVLKAEQQPPTIMDAGQQHRHFHWPHLFKLTMNSAKKWATGLLPPQPFLSFINVIGPQLRSLDLSGTVFTPAHAPALAAVFLNCTRLRKLVFDKCSFDESSARELQTGLSGDELGRQLASLGLNDCVFEGLDHHVIERICMLLGDRTKLPALKKLQLSSSGCTQQALTTLYDVLSARKRLTYLELRIPPPPSRDSGTPLFMSVTPKMLDTKYHNELVGPMLSVEVRMAFLSALKRHQETPVLSTLRSYDSFHALAELDVAVVRIIFQFASSTTHRRRLLWRRVPNEPASSMW